MEIIENFDKVERMENDENEHIQSDLEFCPKTAFLGGRSIRG